MEDMVDNKTEEVKSTDDVVNKTEEVKSTDDVINKMEEVNSTDEVNKEKQNARAFLRERFLRAITALRGQNAEMDMYDNTRVSAQFNCCDLDVQNIVVSNLKTPLGVIPNALLRTNDVYSIHFAELKDLDSDR